MQFLDWKKGKIFGLKLYFFSCFRSMCDGDIEDPENQFKFKVFLRAVVMAFKSISSVDKTVESCTIQTLQKEQKVQITLSCKFSVTKLYSIPCLGKFILELRRRKFFYVKLNSKYKIQQNLIDFNKLKNFPSNWRELSRRIS